MSRFYREIPYRTFMFRAVPDKMLVVESDGGTLVDVWIHGDEVTISLDETGSERGQRAAGLAERSGQVTDFYTVARQATDLFCTFSDEKPAAVDIGIPAIRSRIGRLAGNTVVVGAAQNVGKTSFVQRMLLSSEDKGGVASGEDDVDVWGHAHPPRFSGVSPRRSAPTSCNTSTSGHGPLRWRRSRSGARRVPLPEFENVIGAGPDRLEEAAEVAGREGLQVRRPRLHPEVPGHPRRATARGRGRARPLAQVLQQERDGPVALSQVVRMPADQEPKPWNPKGVRGHRERGEAHPDALARPGDNLVMRCKVAKSSFWRGGPVRLPLRGRRDARDVRSRRTREF